MQVHKRILMLILQWTNHLIFIKKNSTDKKKRSPVLYCPWSMLFESYLLLKVTLAKKISSSLVLRMFLHLEIMFVGIGCVLRNCAYVCFSLQIINTK